MDKKAILRRVSEIIAAVVIVVSIVAYTSGIIKNAVSYSLSIPETSALPDGSKGDRESSYDVNYDIHNSNEDGTYNNQTDLQTSANGNKNASHSGDLVAGITRYNTDNDANSGVNVIAYADTVESTLVDRSSTGAMSGDVEKTADVANDSGENLPPLNSPQAAEQPTEPVYKYINANQLNVRSGPGTDNEKLVTLKKGDSVQVLGQQGDWLQVITSEEIKGYVLAEYVVDSLPPVYMYVTANKLNVRSGPSAQTDKLDTLSKGDKVQVLGNDKEWLNIITSGNVKGYVLAEYISSSVPKVYYYITANKLNVRSGPSAETKKLTTLTNGDRVQFLEKSGEWSKIITSNSIQGYVLSKYITESQQLASRSSGGSVQPYNADKASKILEYAKKFLGVKYVYGGNTPKGFDCSGFTQYVFKNFGISLPRSSEDYGNVGTKVSRNDMKPGDLLLFDRYNSWSLGHVGIYLGGGQFIHASTSRGKVVITNLSTYGGHLLDIRRVIK
jgi:cell wall-associated NlpC family hydrolase